MKTPRLNSYAFLHQFLDFELNHDFGAFLALGPLDYSFYMNVAALSTILILRKVVLIKENGKNISVIRSLTNHLAVNNLTVPILLIFPSFSSSRTFFN